MDKFRGLARNSVCRGKPWSLTINPLNTHMANSA